MCIACALKRFKSYQLALTTPGISPLDASSLKQILQSWKRRMKPRGLPQSLHRLYFLALNFCGLEHFTISDVFAIFFKSFYYFSIASTLSQYSILSLPTYFLKGIPKSFKTSNASSRDFAFVTIVISMPCVFIILSTSTSGNITCSFNPNE